MPTLALREVVNVVVGSSATRVLVATNVSDLGGGAPVPSVGGRPGAREGVEGLGGLAAIAFAWPCPQAYEYSS